MAPVRHSAPGARHLDVSPVEPTSGSAALPVGSPSDSRGGSSLPRSRTAHPRRSRPPNVVTASVPEPVVYEPVVQAPVVHRDNAMGVLRGYRVPLAAHRRAERAKLAAAEASGRTMFWDEIVQRVIDVLPPASALAAELAPGRGEPHASAPAASGVRRRSAAGPGSSSTRVLQATIRRDQELRLRTLRLDLEEALGCSLRLEELWEWLVVQMADGRFADHIPGLCCPRTAQPRING